jgi:hypothetical protein
MANQSETVEDVVVFEVRLRSINGSRGMTEAELRVFSVALERVCQDVLAERGVDAHADKFDVFIRNFWTE